MVNQTLARRYAIAASTLAREQHAVNVGAELAMISEAIGTKGRLRDFFVSPVIGRPEKERVLTEVFEGKIHSIALHTLLLLVRKRREALLEAIVKQYLALERAARGAETMTLTTARTLDRNERAALVQRLERWYGKTFDVIDVVDPALIGGVQITIGDRRIDASISGRLNLLARELASSY